MDNLTAWFFKVTNLQLVLGMCGLYLIFPLYLLPNIINTGSIGPLDLLFWYNHETLYQMLSSYGHDIRQRYILGLLTVDLSYPFFYGTLLVMLIVLVVKNFAIPISQKVIFLPYFAVFFDLIENSLLLFLLKAYPTKHPGLADLAGYITASKWCVFGIILIFLGYLVVYGLRARKKPSLK